ncbi:hypothetical protein NEOLEDRAFT_1178133 [Neolentinus lepideus HHB14362 ss-1]|uniref:Uncharacterized protein n=1 Tax=Neolentinus lepideus HHB14362 ss-1 TaxID=1314782 RepID=A0A165STP9_9AGAM|nr:hypothetical protein NEOLEDRAFT_1178133 [Neolentinus lepideus HHB14362 ss-1]
MSGSQPRNLMMGAAAAAVGVGALMAWSSATPKPTDRACESSSSPRRNTREGGFVARDPSGKPVDANSMMQKGLDDVRQNAGAATSHRPSNDR